MNTQFSALVRKAFLGIAASIFISGSASAAILVSLASGYETTVAGASTFADFSDGIANFSNAQVTITDGQLNGGAMYIGGYGNFISSGTTDRSPVDITFSSLQDYFGLLWGSPDVNRDRIRLYNGATEVASFVLSDFGINPGSAGFIDILATDSAEHFDRVLLDPSGQIAFEADNLAARGAGASASVPTPATLSFLGLGLLLMGLRFRKR